MVGVLFDFSSKARSEKLRKKGGMNQVEPFQVGLWADIANADLREGA